MIISVLCLNTFMVVLYSLRNQWRWLNSQFNDETNCGCVENILVNSCSFTVETCSLLWPNEK